MNIPTPANQTLPEKNESSRVNQNANEDFLFDISDDETALKELNLDRYVYLSIIYPVLMYIYTTGET